MVGKIILSSHIGIYNLVVLVDVSKMRVRLQKLRENHSKGHHKIPKQVSRNVVVNVTIQIILKAKVDRY